MDAFSVEPEELGVRCNKERWQCNGESCGCESEGDMKGPSGSLQWVHVQRIMRVVEGERQERCEAVGMDASVVTVVTKCTVTCGSKAIECN